MVPRGMTHKAAELAYREYTLDWNYHVDLKKKNKRRRIVAPTKD